MAIKFIRNLIVIGNLAILASCGAPKNITYMQGFDQGDVQELVVQRRMTIQPDDKLSIVVSSKDPELAQIFNLPVAQVRIGQVGTNSSTSSSQIAPFTVSADGNVNFPVLGEIHCAGLTRMELASMIENKIKDGGYLKDPVVTVDFLNAFVTVLGDVSSPGEYAITNDDMTILQALGKAGDLKITGMRTNVLVVREDGGKDVAYRLDLTDTKSLMESPAYRLQQNDVVYVEPNSYAKRQSVVNGTSVLTPGFWISIASFAVTIAVLVTK